MLKRVEQQGVVYYVSERLAAIGVPHAFSTRIGGISPLPFDSLNLGNPSGVEIQDSWENIYTNYERLQKAAGVLDRDRCWVHQVHGGDVATVTPHFECGGKADAMVTSDPRKLLSIRIADCVPLLLASPDGKTVAAVHAGWRGVVAKVAVHAIAHMNCPPQELSCAIGPCIGIDAFEVGPEVLAAFHPSLTRRREDGKGHIDLRRALEMQLRQAGVREDHIDISDLCTHRDRHEFFSHRRDNGVSGRLAAIIATTPA